MKTSFGRKSDYGKKLYIYINKLLYIYIYSWVFYNNIKRKSAQQCEFSTIYIYIYREREREREGEREEEEGGALDVCLGRQ